MSTMAEQIYLDDASMLLPAVAGEPASIVVPVNPFRDRTNAAEAAPVEKPGVSNAGEVTSVGNGSGARRASPMRVFPERLYEEQIIEKNTFVDIPSSPRVTGAVREACTEPKRMPSSQFRSGFDLGSSIAPRLIFDEGSEGSRSSLSPATGSVAPDNATWQASESDFDHPIEYARSPGRQTSASVAEYPSTPLPFPLSSSQPTTMKLNLQDLVPADTQTPGPQTKPVIQVSLVKELEKQRKQEMVSNTQKKTISILEELEKQEAADNTPPWRVGALSACKDYIPEAVPSTPLRPTILFSVLNTSTPETRV